MAKLLIVPTPIGNTKDLSPRGLEALNCVEYIACEDTRVTLKLLNIFKIKAKKLIAYHQFNEKESAQKIIKIMLKNNDVALVSDAGVPNISDPGYNLIQLAIENNQELEFIPGPCALIGAIVLANFSQTFSFLGFLAPKTLKRQNQLKKLVENTYVTYVSPYKLLKTLDDVEQVWGPKTPVFLVKELTKKFEKHYRGDVAKVKNILEQEKIQGEFTLVFQIKHKI